jgi:hypothetical protein
MAAVSGRIRPHEIGRNPLTFMVRASLGVKDVSDEILKL